MMFAFMIVFVVAVVVGIVFLVRYLVQASSLPAAWSAGMPTAAAAPESPKDVLKRRYAAGEIDRAEYLQTLDAAAWRPQHHQVEPQRSQGDAATRRTREPFVHGIPRSRRP